MNVSAEFLAELKGFYPDAKSFTEGGLIYIHLPKLILPRGEEAEGLLLLNGAGSYTTRLFLAKEISGSQAKNWSAHQILNKTWYTWSWKDVPSDGRYVEILVNHLRALA